MSAVVAQPEYKDAPSPVAEDGSVKIREIWTGNLASTVTEGKLYTYFFIYGEIERIDMFMFKNFAFVRFKEVAAACRAYELAKGIRIDGRPVKISFSDHTRRKDAIGDLPGYYLTEHNAKALLLKYKSTNTVPPEETLRGILSQYGKLQAINIMEVPQDPNFNPHVYIDFFSHVLAINC